MSESVVLEKSKANTQTVVFFYTTVKAKELCELSQTASLASRAVAVLKHGSDGLNTLLMCLSKMLQSCSVFAVCSTVQLVPVKYSTNPAWSSSLCLVWER